MATKPFLMGFEVEYSMSSPQPREGRMRGRLHERLLDAIRADHYWLPDIRASSGIYIDNGSRYYLDAGKHNEFCSPELSSPREIAVFDRAAEKILRRAQAVVKSGSAGVDICITKNNVNPHCPEVAAWGQHEAYTCWVPLDIAAHQLIPHLVSRIPYAGAGCLSEHPDGMGFELSQRAQHITCTMGVDTTRDRAVFCTRAWKPSDGDEAGWTRTNLISKDSQRCPFGMYLTYGVTGLLFMIMNEGHRIGRRVQLKEPVAAMRAFSLDPWLKTKVTLTNGQRVTAVDIQREYLREARQHVACGDYPNWTSELLGLWSTTLDQLEKDPRSLAHRLDTYMKLAILERQLARSGTSWKSLHQSLQILGQLRRTASDSVTRESMSQEMDASNVKYRSLFERLLKKRNVAQDDVDRIHFAVRMQALELNYHELGGLFDKLVAAGKVDPVVVTAKEVQRAMHHAPSGGRAAARGKLIRKLYRQPWSCDWQYVVNHARDRWADLRDPFTGKRGVITSCRRQRSGSMPVAPERSR